MLVNTADMRSEMFEGRRTALIKQTLTPSWKSWENFVSINRY